MTLRVRVAIALLVAAAVAVVAVWFAMSNQNGSVQADKRASSTTQPTKGSPTTAGSTQSTTLTPGEAKQLATDLLSQDNASYRSAWATDTLPPKAPAGTRLVIDAGTFTSQQDAGKVNATITLPGKASEVWRLLLLRKDGRWAVYTMEEVK